MNKENYFKQKGEKSCPDIKTRVFSKYIAMSFLEEHLNDVVLGNAYELIKKIPDKSIDCIYTDIPYLYLQNGGGTVI